MLVPVSPRLSGSPPTESGLVESHHFVLALEMKLYGAVIAITTWIRKENPLTEASFQEDTQKRIVF